MKLHPLPLAAGALCAALLLGCSADSSKPEMRDLAALTGPAFARGGAGPPLSGQGTGTISSIKILSNRIAGRGFVQDRRLDGSIKGALEGTAVEHVKGVIHPNGRVTFDGIIEFTGRVPQCGPEEGKFTAKLAGHGRVGVPVLDIPVVTDAVITVINQASNTLGVSATGTVHQVGSDFTYRIKFLCR